MNYDEIFDAVILYSGIDPDEADIDFEAMFPSAIARAEQIIFQEVELVSQLKSAKLMLNADGSRYVFPDDHYRTKSIRILQKAIPMADVNSLIDYSYWDDPFASDVAYGITEGEIFIGPNVPDTPYIEYLTKHTPLTPTSPLNGIVTEYPFIYIDMIIYCLYLILGYEQAAGARESAEDLIGRANQNEIRKAR